jgi:hypothetical protein
MNLSVLILPHVLFIVLINPFYVIVTLDYARK